MRGLTMSKKEENLTAQSGMLSSKFMRTLLVIVSVFLIFAGPTYFIYGLAVLLGVNLAASFAAGFVLFVIGLVLMWYLVRNKVIT
jgi:hypothetical protein